MPEKRAHNSGLEFDFNKLVPELAEWGGGHGIDIGQWIEMVGSYEHAIAYGKLFWPDFIEHDGCVLFAAFNVASYRGFPKQTHGNKKAVEAGMNHHHISDFFPNKEPTENQVVYLGRLLKDIWQTKLTRDFPARHVVVEFNERDGAALLDYQITFYQPINDSASP